VFIETKVDGGGGDNWTTGAISRAKLQSNHHHEQTNIQFLQAAVHQLNVLTVAATWTLSSTYFMLAD